MNRFVEVDLRNPETLSRRFEGGIPCFLLGYSKSLNLLDLTKMSGQYTAGINWVLRRFAPTFMFMMDAPVLEIEAERIRRSPRTLVLTHPNNHIPGRHLWWEVKDWVYREPIAPIHGVFDPMPWRGSSAPPAVCFLYALGFDPIYLVGIDYNIKPGQTDRDTHASDVPAYSRERGLSAITATRMFSAINESLFLPCGRQLVNLSPVVNPEFDCLPRKSFDEVLP